VSKDEVASLLRPDKTEWGRLSGRPHDYQRHITPVGPAQDLRGLEEERDAVVAGIHPRMNCAGWRKPREHG
jgi:hypothetical protein